MTQQTRNIVLLTVTAIALSGTATFSAPTSGTVQFSASTYTVNEDAGVATITVLRTRGGGPVTVHYATSDGTATAGTDYTLSEGTLTFGARDTRKTFMVPLTNDALVNGLRTVHLTLSAPTGGAVLGSHSTAVLQILDDDRGGVVQFGAPTYSVSEGAGTATLTVVRTEGRAGGVTVAYATSNGTATAGADYTATSGTLTFAAGASRHTVTIPIATDALIEGDETVRVTLSSPGGGAVLGGQRTAVLTIVDDDAAVQFSQPRYRVGETGGSAAVTVERVGGTAGTVTVPYATSPGTALADLHYTDVAGTLTFTAGVKSRTFTVPVLADGQVTADKTVTLTLSTPTGASLGTPNTAVLTIVNTDSASGPVLTGTAAAGAPLASRLIRIKDKLGVKRTGIIDSQGKYTFTVSGLSAPYLLKVEPPNTPVAEAPGEDRFQVVPVSLTARYQSGSWRGQPWVWRVAAQPVDFGTVALFSVGTANGVVNIHPFTDLIIRTWYQVQGTTVEAAFEDPVHNPPPTTDQVAVIASLVEDMLKLWLTANGLDPITFDLITSPFDADGTGFDRVLELVSSYEVDPDVTTTSVTLADATTSVTQATALTIVNQILKASTTATGAGGATSASITSAVVPTDPAVQAALDGVFQSLANFRTVVNSKGAALKASDIQPFFDANYLNRGEAGPFLGAASLATDLRGETINSFRADSIVSYDDTSKVLCVIGIVSFTVNGQTFESVVAEERGLCFKRGTDSIWRFFGDQRIAKAKADARLENRFVGDPNCTECDGVFKVLFIHVTAPQGTLSGASVSGTDGLNETLPKNPLVFVRTLQPNPPPALPLLINEDSFDNGQTNGGTVTSFPPVGTVYTFTINLTLGGSVTYTDTVQATTEETITITNLTGHNLVPDAHLGSPLTVTWTLPTTFPIQRIKLRGFVAASDGQGGTVGCNVHSDLSDLPSTATSATITLPTTCSGLPIGPLPSNGPAPAAIQVVITGTHGEETLAYWAFH